MASLGATALCAFQVRPTLSCGQLAVVEPVAVLPNRKLIGGARSGSVLLKLFIPLGNCSAGR